MRTLPKPQPGEIIYSALARAAVRYGFCSSKRLLDPVDGRRPGVAVPKLPSRLAPMAGTAHDQWLRVEEPAARRTLVGYDTDLHGAHRRSQLLAAPAGDRGSLQRSRYSQEDKADADAA